MPALPLARALLAPGEAAAGGLAPEALQRMWPAEAATKPFIDFLKGQYDHTQLSAIEAAAAHLGAAPARPASGAAGGAPGGADERLPFVLIQGPPGTGKTHTVKGILNVWHLVLFQRYYTSLVAALAADARAGAAGVGLQSALERRLPNLAAKPRVLVCAPSNAAADELLQRVMDAGFAGADGAPPLLVASPAPGSCQALAACRAVNRAQRGLLGSDSSAMN